MVRRRDRGRDEARVLVRAVVIGKMGCVVGNCRNTTVEQMASFKHQLHGHFPK
jgi:hypothetical protein